MKPGAGGTLVVSEVFGPTVQGEGPHAGQRAAFVRLGGCNLTCSWCDTPYTWDGRHYDLRTELRRVSVQDVRDRVREMLDATSLVVISGGEPLLQQRHGLTRLARLMRREGYRLDVETNGTIPADPELVDVVGLFVVSPKLPHAGMPMSKTIRPEQLTGWARPGLRAQVAFKFVCQGPADVQAVHRLADKYNIWPGQVWIMPEGVDADTLLRRGRELIDPAVDAGFNYTSRLHVLLWGMERAR